jgi:SET domain-containing protein
LYDDEVRDPAGLPRIARRRSAVHGHGVFAAETIAKNTRIIDYAGELVPNEECEAREARYLEQGCTWVFRVNRRWSRDAAVGGNIARFITTRALRTAGSRSSTGRSGFAPAGRSGGARN